MRPTIALILLNILLFSISSASAQANEKWLEDYSAMKKFMSEAYANLEWARTRIDLVELDKKTLDALKKADSDAAARKVLDQFLSEFRDGHLRLQEVKADSGNHQKTAIPADATAAKACGDMGYRLRMAKFSTPFDTVAGFRRINAPADPFPSGVFPVANGKNVAVINIPIFMQQGYFGLCSKAWEEVRPNLTAPCDDKCVDGINRRVEEMLTKKLAEQIGHLNDHKPDHFIVDIGGNGGGNDWVKTVAGMLSPKPLRPIRSGFIRHPHWVPIMEGNLGPINADLARKDITEKQRTILFEAKKRLERLVSEAKSACDMSFVWTTNEPRKNCTRLNSEPMYSSGLFERLSPEILNGLSSRKILYKDTELAGTPVLKQNPILLVDRRTASASEMLASLMQISGSATVIGEKTAGAGCGYVDGGTKYFLPNSKLRLWMPDCVRYRADGANEVEGIKPDVLLWETNADPTTRSAKVLEYLSSLK
jgi:Peptidase family S41